jgi:hypothetical protein
VSRTELLQSLLRWDRPLTEIAQELSRFEWDSSVKLVILRRDHVLNTLSRYLKDELLPSLIEDWANMLEGRDDVGFESSSDDLLREAIHELANPVLSKETARAWIARLQT